MQQDNIQNKSGHTTRNAVFAFLILIVVALVLGLGFMKPKFPHSDAIRYIGYAINLNDHRVFSSSRDFEKKYPKPTSVHAPLYPMWIAAFAYADRDLYDTLKCAAVTKNKDGNCPRQFQSIVTAQLILAGIFLGCVWLFARRISGNETIAWIAALCALAARNPLQYANQILTEALLVPLLGLFILFLTIAYQDRKPSWMLAAGAALGLAALTRPAYAYLFLALGSVLFVAAAITWRRRLAIACLCFALAYGALVTPWMMRTHALSGKFALTTGYAGDILSQRVAYNRMTWPEWGVSFLYWFPDFGDELAGNLFARENYQKLGWNEGSYYATVAPALYQDISRQVSDPGEIVSFIIRNEIIENPIKHAAVTLTLAFRAVFVSKYWGIFGLICFIMLTIRLLRRREYTFPLLSLPIWFMVAFHALVSVSIPRYNLALIPFYAYAMAWVFHACGCRVSSILKQRNATKTKAAL